MDGIDSVLHGRRILVTGATGFIGSALAMRLHSAGAHILALERTPGRGSALAEAGIECIRGDLADARRIAEIVSQDVEIVMHLGAWLSGRSWRNAELINVEATKHLAEVSVRCGVERFVFVSSIAVYGSHGDNNVDEQHPVTEYGDPYGDSKILAEAVLQQISQRNSLPYVIVRPGMVYGPRSPGWTVRLARWAKAGRIPLIDDGRGTAYPIYIDNLLDLLLLCAAHPAASCEIFNAVDDGPVTLQEFLGAYMQMIPARRAIRVPGWVANVIATLINPLFPDRNYQFIVSQMRGRGMVMNQKAKDVLGWQPRVSLTEGLHRSEVWLRSEGII